MMRNVMKRMIILVAIGAGLVAGLAACGGTGSATTKDYSANPLYAKGGEAAELTWKTLVTGSDYDRTNNPITCRMGLNRFLKNPGGEWYPKTKEDQSAFMAGCKAKITELAVGEWDEGATE
ncbi:hypothetical protein OG589_08470 [Sphaerisporangium sp. NBC_01403]|uniref:hypothetical protein n=1 Tax=Sphaerisporangium sp. NBC_01403 TaxID=2903599 RepID=UPI0032540AD0